MAALATKTRVNGACALKPAYISIFWVWKAVVGLKLARREGYVGLGRESVDFSDIQKVETLILVILGLNLSILMISSPVI